MGNSDTESRSRTGGRDPAVPYLDAADVEAVPFAEATDAITRALVEGLDPAADPARVVLPVTAGQLLLMPGEAAGYVGVKIVGLAPDNPARGLARIQGSYLLLDGATLQPLAIIDGAALTTLRTPAVSAAAARALAPRRAGRLVVLGTGPQAAGHIRALHDVLAPEQVTVLSRNAGRAADLAGTMQRELGLPGHGAGTADPGSADEIARADVIVCATTATRPLFPADAVRPGALVIAVGSHQPDVLELDPVLLARSQVVVEDAATATREAGEVVTAIRQGLLDPTDLVGLGSLVTGSVAADIGRTRVFKSVGMGWEDLVVATRVFARSTQSGGDDDG
jgi:ornithine cyclodeaminase